MAVLFAMEGAVAQGILWGLMTLGVYLTFRILNVADMTVDGSFAAGGAVTAILIVKGMNPIFTLLFVFIAGMLCGLATGFMNTKLKINILLASILTQIALYSINIRIMGKANTPLLGNSTMMSMLKDFSGGRLTTTSVSMSGALVAQSQGYADVGMGTGTIVIGLASIIIGEVIFGSKFGFWWTLLSAVFGSIIYRIVIAVVLQLGLKSTDLKLLTALIVAVALSVPVVKAKIDRRRRSLPGMNLNEEENTRHVQVKKHGEK